MAEKEIRSNVVAWAKKHTCWTTAFAKRMKVGTEESEGRKERRQDGTIIGMERGLDKSIERATTKER